MRLSGTQPVESLEQALRACAISGSTLELAHDFFCVANKNLYVYGSFDIRAEKGALLRLSENLKDNFRYWVNFGITGKGERVRTYSGTVSGLTISLVGEAFTHRCLYLHRAHDTTFRDLHFDFRGAPSCPATGIEGGNDSAWCKHPRRDRITIENCTILAHQSRWGGEGFGQSSAQSVRITGCRVYGVGDDVIALHDCTDFEISGNRCDGVDGAIIFTNCRRGVVANNDVRRIQAFDGDWRPGGQLIACYHETTHAQKTSDILVANNRVHLPAEIPGATYGIRIKNADNVLVVGNQIRCDSPYAQVAGGIAVVSDSTQPPSQGIHLHSNVLYGETPQDIIQLGPSTTFYGAFNLTGNICRQLIWPTGGFLTGNVQNEY